MLETLPQIDFSGGMFRGVATHLIPERGVFDARNALLDDDGSIYKRGGSAYLSTDGLGSAGLTFLWDGYLAPGRRTVLANSADFGVLSAAEATVNLGGAGVAAPVRAVEIGGALVIGGGTIYAGSRKSADYATGTVAVTNGLLTVTGTGSDWDPNVDAGMLFKRAGDPRYYVVASVDSDTQLTLTEPYEGVTGSGASYTATRLGTAPKTASIYAVVANRLVALSGNRIDFSNARDEDGNLHWQTFDATDFHLLPDGTQILGAAVLSDTLIVFTTQGVYTVSNMAYDLIDDVGNVQHRVERLSPDLILWSNEGIAAWQNALIVPATDGVWLLDGQNPPSRISQSITDLYEGYVNAGDHTGLAHVYRNHFFLPVLAASGAFVDLLVCRLDRPQRTGLGVVFPWTRFDGSGAEICAFDVRVSSTSARQPKLLAASLGTDSRVLNCSSYFTPAQGVSQDHDETDFELDVITRDYSPGKLNVRALVRRLRLRYELVGSDGPTIAAYYSVGVQQGNLPLWGTAIWGTDVWGDSSSSTDVQLSGQAPVSDGRDPYAWRFAANCRRIRFRFRSSQPAASLVLRTLELFVRPSGRSA